MAWSMTVPTRHVDDDGTALITAVFSDEHGQRGTFTLRLTSDADLSVLWTQADGAQPVQFTGAWSTT